MIVETLVSKTNLFSFGNLLNNAAGLKIDATPMEGFIPAQVNEILGLDKLGLNATFLQQWVTDMKMMQQHYKKVRKSNEDLFITL
jgi:nitroreductase